jgi:hypothetical protein
VFSVWSVAWTAYKDDLSDAKIDNFANHYGNFDTEAEAMTFAASLPPEKIHKSNDLLDTMYVIEKRAVIYSRIALAPNGIRQ